MSCRLPNAYMSTFGINQSGQGWALWCDRPIIRHLYREAGQQSRSVMIEKTKKDRAEGTAVRGRARPAMTR